MAISINFISKNYKNILNRKQKNIKSKQLKNVTMFLFIKFMSYHFILLLPNQYGTANAFEKIKESKQKLY